MRVRNLIALFIVPALLLLVTTGFGQQKTFKWADELCRYQGTYNSKKYTAKQLANTAKLFDHGSFSFQPTATVFTPVDLGRFDLAAVDAEYQKVTAELTELEIVNTPFWQELRKQKLAEIKQVYELSRLTILGHTDPKVLNQLEGSQSCKTKYAAPLIAGGDSLLKAWKTLNEESRKQNGNPNEVKRKFESEMASKDRLKFALVEVMTFGWWNCANNSIKYVNYDGTQEREFRKLFVRVKKIECEEP